MDVSEYFETFPRYQLYLGLANTMGETADGSSTIFGWLDVFHEESYEFCFASAVIDMSTGDLSNGVNILAHEYNMDCSFEG